MCQAVYVYIPVSLSQPSELLMVLISQRKNTDTVKGHTVKKCQEQEQSVSLCEIWSRVPGHLYTSVCPGPRAPNAESSIGP